MGNFTINSIHCPGCSNFALGSAGGEIPTPSAYWWPSFSNPFSRQWNHRRALSSKWCRSIQTSTHSCQRLLGFSHCKRLPTLLPRSYLGLQPICAAKFKGPSPAFVYDPRFSQRSDILDKCFAKCYSSSKSGAKWLKRRVWWESLFFIALPPLDCCSLLLSRELVFPCANKEVGI